MALDDSWILVPPKCQSFFIRLAFFDANKIVFALVVVPAEANNWAGNNRMELAVAGHAISPSFVNNQVIPWLSFEDLQVFPGDNLLESTCSHILLDMGFFHCKYGEKLL